MYLSCTSELYLGVAERDKDLFRFDIQSFLLSLKMLREIKFRSTVQCFLASCNSRVNPIYPFHERKALVIWRLLSF